MTPELDRLLAAVPADLRGRSLGELRDHRRVLQRWETAVSLTRRVSQGRLDILGYELGHRTGEVRSTPDSLLFDLPDILSEESSGQGGRAVAVGGPGPEAEELTALLDEVATPSVLCAAADVPTPQLQALADRLQELERRLSSTRRSLHASIDALQGEIGRRYRDGEASVESLLG